MTADQYQKTALESQIQNAICQWLALKRIPYSVTDASLCRDRTGKFAAKRKVTTVGWPDVTACIAGRFVAIEVKTAKGKLRDSQISCLEEIERNGGIVCVIRSFDEAERKLSGLLKG